MLKAFFTLLPRAVQIVQHCMSPGPTAARKRGSNASCALLQELLALRSDQEGYCDVTQGFPEGLATW